MGLPVGVRDVQVVDGELDAVRLGVGEAEGLGDVPVGLAVRLRDAVNVAVGWWERLRLVEGVRVEGVRVVDGLKDGADWLSVRVQLKVAVASMEGRVPDGLRVGVYVDGVGVCVTVGADTVRDACRDAVEDPLSVE